MRAPGFGGSLGEIHADQREILRQHSGARQIVERGRHQSLGQVAARAKDDHGAKVGGAGREPSGVSRICADAGAGSGAVGHENTPRRFMPSRGRIKIASMRHGRIGARGGGRLPWQDISPPTSPPALPISRSNMSGANIPSKLDHVLAGPRDARTPSALHPVFYGSFDWHSCVHGYWMLPAAAAQISRPCRRR